MIFGTLSYPNTWADKRRIGAVGVDCGRRRRWPGWREHLAGACSRCAGRGRERRRRRRVPVDEQAGLVERGSRRRERRQEGRRRRRRYRQRRGRSGRQQRRRPGQLEQVERGRLARRTSRRLLLLNKVKYVLRNRS